MNSMESNQVVSKAAMASEQDIAAVLAVFYRYTWSLDGKDWATLRTCFTDDMVFEANNMGRYVGPETLIAAFQQRAVRIHMRRHAITNPYVTISGDNAQVTAYLINTRVREGAPGGDFFMGGGYYRNSFRRTPDGWRMMHLRFESTFLEGNPRLDPSLPAAPNMPTMASMTDAPWPPSGADPDATEERQIRNLVLGLVRAADAGVTSDVAACLAANAKADLGSGAMSGAEAVADSLAAPADAGTRQTFLINEGVDADTSSGRYSAYIYRVTGPVGLAGSHEGGFLTCAVSKIDGSWRVTDLQQRLLWDRDTKVDQPPAGFLGAVADAAFDAFPQSRQQPRGAEQAIAGLLANYAWCYDFGRFDRMKELFAEDIDGSFMPAPGRHSGRDRLIAALSGQRDKVPFSQHHLTNPVVTFDIGGKSADVRCYAFTRRTPEGGGAVDVTGGRYDGHAVLMEGEWRLAVFGYTRVHGGYH